MYFLQTLQEVFVPHLTVENAGEKGTESTFLL